MVKVENVTINGKEFKRYYSDNNKVIKKVGTEEEYTEAIDVLSANYEYEETDKKIEQQEEEQQ